MYRLQVKSHFDSGHYLRGYKGKCSRPHGHRFEYEVVIEGDELNEIGILVDFVDVKKAMKEVEEILDHQMLNEIGIFKSINPTAENLSRFIFVYLSKCLPNVVRVTVWESPDCCVKYYESITEEG
jgi:6-pyruvoyltetrahydropterin/6-carboxytetrahydropterin synthase